MKNTKDLIQEKYVKQTANRQVIQKEEKVTNLDSYNKNVDTHKNQASGRKPGIADNRKSMKSEANNFKNPHYNTMYRQKKKRKETKMGSPNNESESRDRRMIQIYGAPAKYKKCTLTKVQISISSSKYIQRTLTKVRISVSSTKYKQRTLTKVQISVSSSKHKSQSCEQCMIRRQAAINETQKRQEHWIPRNSKAKTSADDRSLTAVRLTLTAVKLLTSTSEENLSKMTNHDESLHYKRITPTQTNSKNENNGKQKTYQKQLPPDTHSIWATQFTPYGFMHKKGPDNA